MDRKLIWISLPHAENLATNLIYNCTKRFG